jgi:hypothetical protein
VQRGGSNLNIRERVERGKTRWGKRKRPGGFRLNSHLLPPPRIITERGREAARVRPAGGDCRRAGPRQRPGCGGKWRGRRGRLIPTLILGRGGARRRLHRRRRTGGGGARGRRRSGAQPRGEGGRGDAWQPGERLTPFIGGGRRFGRGFFSSSGSFDGSITAVEGK